MKKSISNRLLVGIILGSVACILVIIATCIVWPGLFEAFEAKSLDWRYLNRLKTLYKIRQGASIEDIIIVDIDNRSLEKLGQFNQWPRTYHAQLIDYLSEGGALAIGFDVLFMEPDRNPEHDRALITSTRRGNNTFHSMAFSMADPNAFLYPMENPPEGFDFEKFSIVLPDRVKRRIKQADRMDGKIIELYNVAAGIGFANFSPDNDSVIRTMPLFLTFAGRQYLSLALSIVLGVLGADGSHLAIAPGKEITISPPGGEGKQSFRIPIDKNSRMLINYQGTFQTFRYISYYDALMHRIPKEMFEGRIVLVGTSAAGLSDIRPVPFQDAFPGVEVHANIIYNILSQRFIIRQKIAGTIANTLLLAVLIALLAMLLRPGVSFILVAVCSGIYSIFAYSLFAQNAYWIELVRPILAAIFAYLFVFMYRYVDEERNKRFIKNMFQHYLTASVVDEMLKRPEMLRLGGERRVATAFFSDIKNFTTVSENLSPEELVAQLNEYLSAMTEVVLKYEGYLDKYEGDAIMAIFGVPVDQKDHATRACLAALEMQEILVELRERWQADDMPAFHVRIGINTGPMIAGNIGGTERFDYTVIGDAVNLASRLEGANKTYDTSIMISEFTREQLDEDIAVRELDLIRVKGKIQPVRVYEVIAEKRSALSNAQLLLCDEFEQGRIAYRKREWKDALAAFQRALLAVPSDGPSETYINRCSYFSKSPPPAQWDGVFEMKSK